MELFLLLLLSIVCFGTASELNTTTCTIPSLFKDSESGNAPPKVHVIMYGTTGDFFKELSEGMKSQASATFGHIDGIELIFTESNGNLTRQAELVSKASTDPDAIGILTIDGNSDNLCTSIKSSIKDNNLPVVSFDFDGNPCSSTGQIIAAQQDDAMVSLVLTQAVNDRGGNINVGYVSDLNYPPLQRRNEVWELYKERNNWTQLFFVDNAADYSTAEELQSAIEEAIKGSPQVVDFIYAPWDHLSVNTVQSLHMTDTLVDTAVYGADINNEDIQVMIETDSPWMATAGGDPRAIGASLIRMVALAASGELDIIYVRIPSFLFTQDFLISNSITNMNKVHEAMPETLLPDFMTACWINIEYTDEAESHDHDHEEETTASTSSAHTSSIEYLIVSLILSAIPALFLLG